MPKLSNLIIILGVLFPVCLGAAAPVQLPWVDISQEKSRHVIIAKGTPELYNGHPTTVMLKDNKTIFCAWSRGHGGIHEFLSMSRDAGKTWEPQTVPKDWLTTKNCPSIYLLEDKNKKERLFIFSGQPDMSQTYSEDFGKTWSPVRSLNLPCTMAFCGIVKLKNGDHLGLYHGKGHLWQSISSDGGLTWSPGRSVGTRERMSACEPFVMRSPDGKQLLCVARENRRTGHSLMMTSNDEGKTWTRLEETAWALTGDRHIIKYTPDKRLVGVFRDMAPNSPTKGHFVAWVGTYKDIINGLSGQYRVKLLHSHAGSDCGYPGLEILPDGTIIATTYIKYLPGKAKHSVVSVRFKLEETDKMVAAFLKE